MTKMQEKRYDDIQQLGCICCYLDSGIWGTPCEIHHKRAGYGMSQRAPWYETMGLCPGHHRGIDGRPSVHGSPRKWHKRYSRLAWRCLHNMAPEDVCIDALSDDPEDLLIRITDEQIYKGLIQIEGAR